MSKNKKLVPKRRFKAFQNTDDWEQRELGDLAEIVRGASPRPIQNPKWFDQNSEIGWLRISDVSEQNGRIYFLEQRISEAGQGKTRVLHSSHLLLSIAATVGKPVTNYVPTGVHDGFLIFLNPKFDLEFMFQWLEMFRPQWQKYGQPGSQVNLNSDLVKNQKIFIPSLGEQKEISSFFTNLDQTIAFQQRKLEKMKSMKSAYLSEMFPAEGERKPKRRFPGFTDDWEQRELGERAKFINGRAYSQSELLDSGKYKVLRVGNFYTNSSWYYSDMELGQKYYAEKGDLLYTWSATFGPHIWDGEKVIYHYHIWKIELDDSIDKSFILQVLNNDKEELLRSTNGSTMVHITKELMESKKFLFPSLNEQKRIGTFFLELDETIAFQQQKLEKLQNIKKAYLNEMFI